MTAREEILRDLAGVINRHSLENASATPDFILAEYLLDCLGTWNRAAHARERWYGRDPAFQENPLNLQQQYIQPPARSSLKVNIFTGQACCDGGEHVWSVRPTADASGRVERYCVKCHVTDLR
jgi:hypothetical protein